ncbi:MAG: hypothetical protein MHM6MM_008780 [Cercozoa sp. M6MM]
MAKGNKGKTSLPAPPGYIRGSFSDAPFDTSDDSQLQLRSKQAMAVARSPLGSLFQTALMLWMAGSSLQIFSIMMIGMALFRPISALFKINQAFRSFDGSGVDLALPKLVYAALQLAGLGIALYKLHGMGVLPTAASVAQRAPQESLQTAFVRILG